MAKRSLKKQMAVIILLLCVIAAGAQQKLPVSYDHVIRVACVGASTTYGANIDNQPLNSFPAQLARMLGDKWEVRNFGVNSTGILKKGDFPYWNTAAFKAAQAFAPDVVVLMLGVNDVKPQNWRYKADFMDNYKEMIGIFRRLPSHPKVYLCREIPVFGDHWGIRARVVKEELYPMKKKLAKQQHLPLIDLYTPLVNDPEMFTDGVHPDARGAGVMAQTVARALTAKDLQPVSAVYPGKKSEWSGFDAYDFQYDLLNAKLVLPHAFAKGNPWIWNCYFWGWHPEMERVLLDKGFAVFYVNTSDMFGSAEAMKDWDELYKYLTGYYHLNKKAAFESVSRGALYMYNFAKLYPERITCLYGEAPVCDIKSWPGGFERSPGDSAEWKKLLKALHLTQQQALQYRGNPIDSLEKLARYHIPIWHSIGLNDSLAPPEENTFILANRYIRLGGEMTVYPNTKGKTELHGHHFPIDDPGAGADFIFYHYLENEEKQ